MSLTDLQSWLVREGIKPELDFLSRMTAVLELDNLTVENSELKVEWGRLLMAASILARSTERSFQEAALRIAIGALTLKTKPEVRDAGALLLDKLSNHRAIALAKARQLVVSGLEGRLGASLRLETQRRRLQDFILVESTGGWVSVNQFQYSFWTHAPNESGWISASAPTASGKTFLVLQWLVNSMLTGAGQVAVYLAPTRALVTEVESSLRAILESENLLSLEVTSIPVREKYDIAVRGGRKLVFVITQERLHLLANMLEHEIRVDLLIVDEAHKIGDSQRGVILQDAVERVSRNNQSMRVVFISPSTQNPAELLADAPEGAATQALESDVPTVLQNVILASQVARRPKEWLLSLRQGAEAHVLGTLHLANKPSDLKKKLLLSPPLPEPEVEL